MVNLVSKCSAIASYNPTTGTGNNTRQNVSTRTSRPIGLPDFVMDVSGANVFSDANKIPDASVRRITWSDPVHTVNVTTQSQQPAQNRGCNFENAWCGYTHGTGPALVRSVFMNAWADIVNGAAHLKISMEPDAVQRYVACVRSGAGGPGGFGCTFPANAFMQIPIPAGTNRVSFSKSQVVNNPSGYDIQLQLHQDNLPDTPVSGNGDFTFDIVDPSQSHTLYFNLSGFGIDYAPNFYSAEVFIDNIVFSGSNTPPPSSTRPYSLRIKHLKGNGGWVATESLPVLNTARPRLILPMDSFVDIRGTIEPSGPPITEIWAMIQGLGAHTPMTPRQFAEGFTLNNSGHKFFTVEAGEAFHGGGVGNENIYALDILADTSNPVDNLSAANLATLGANLVLPWYGAVMPYSYQDDTAMKGMKIV
ncbi:MAG: hypothetical protein Q7T11_09585, partial [Deltaproteobacteria bacterium]|nr:hypothetical protein [Deltaproteobacteria bacterium]